MYLYININYYTRSHKIEQKSAQVLCLLRVLPFILSDRLPDMKTKYIKLISYLNEIHKIINSNVVNSV